MIFYDLFVDLLVCVEKSVEELELVLYSFLNYNNYYI